MNRVLGFMWFFVGSTLRHAIHEKSPTAKGMNLPSSCPTISRCRPNLSPIPSQCATSPCPYRSPCCRQAQPSLLDMIAFSDLQRIELIGYGNGGKVYLVRHKPTGAQYTLKVIYGNHDDNIRRQICCEIEILKTASSPHLVRSLPKLPLNVRC